MASAPQQQSLPLLYHELVPLQSQVHGGWKARRMENLSLLRGIHAVPLTVEEFVAAQRSYPIIFSVGDDPVPLALMGLNEGVNMFLNEEGHLREDAYLPAYVRRYPFMLVRLSPDREDLSLCFDSSPGLLGEFEEGSALFVDGEPSPEIKGTLEFCEQFEIAAQRTGAFVRELQQMGLLTEGEITIQPAEGSQPFVYRGFQLLNEEKFRELRGDQLRKMMQSGMLPALHAHLFSLGLLRTLFDMQVRAGVMPRQA